MTSISPKTASKMKLQNTEMRTTYKPILPKLNSNMMTRVIEINAPTLPMCKCFVCDERVISSGVPLLQSTTQASNTDLPTKIGQLMGERFMVVVSADDVLCRKCHALVNHVDRLESDLLLVKKSLRDHLKKKYNLNEEEMRETETLVNPRAEIVNDADTEYVIIQDGESEEDAEPPAKKGKTDRQVRFRAIKPKPSLLKCSSCDFITTQADLLACHRLTCTSMAYKCTMCDKKFDSQKMIRNHKIEAHLTKWICHFCNVSFNEENKFTMHMKNHLGDRLIDKKAKAPPKQKTDSVSNEQSYKCPHCEESFEALSQLQIHLVNHTSSVTFKCVRCDIGFESKQDLINHVKSHDGTGEGEYIIPENMGEALSETLYTCPTCSLSFLQEDLYLQHLSLHSAEEGESINLFIEQTQENGDKIEDKSVECPNCGERKEDEEILEMHRLTECTGTEKKADDFKETDLQQNAGEEASHLELNQLLYVNSLNVQLIDGNVVIQNVSGEKNAETNPNEPATNNKSVEDILEKMFQVEEGNVKEESEENELPETERHLSNLKQNKNKTFVCANCAFSTQNLGALKQHFIAKHEAFKCWICSKTFQMDALKKHLEEEHGETQQTKCYPCDHCSEKFPNRRALYLHEVTHPENLTIQCPDCGEKFARDKFLNEHRDTAHAVSHCRVCNKSFNNVKQLKSHEARHARSDRNHFKCTDCGREFQTPTGLRHHKAVHTGEYKFKCEFCSKGFVSRVRYEEHRASHTKEERYSCEICGKKFSFQATYWIHRKWHDNPTPYKCEYCGRLFKHSSLLSVHKRKHTGERPYECPHCDQSFTVGNTLKRHLMLHTGVFPFTCPVCDQGFSGKHKMAQHMSKAHQDNSYLEKNATKKPIEYKMVVKQDEDVAAKPEEVENHTWILTDNENQTSQVLTIQTEEGESIPCTLLTDEMIGDMVTPNNRIVEIIPYGALKMESGVEPAQVNFIQRNPSEQSNFGMGSDDDEFGNHNQVYSDADVDSKTEMNDNSQSNTGNSLVTFHS